MTTPTTDIDATTKPIYAALGAGDAVFAAAQDIVTKARERAESARTDVQEKATIDELKRLIDEYRTIALDRYAEFAERGVAAADKLRARPVVDENIDRVEALYKDVVARAEELIERASKLAGRTADDAETVAAPSV